MSFGFFYAPKSLYQLILPLMQHVVLQL